MVAVLCSGRRGRWKVLSVCQDRAVSTSARETSRLPRPAVRRLQAAADHQLSFRYGDGWNYRTCLSGRSGTA
jgi:hypothetical protein